MVSKLTIVSAACAVSAIKETSFEPIQTAELAQLRSELQN